MFAPRVLLSLIICFSLIATVACDDDPAGPTTPRGVYGNVVDESGTPIPEAAVSLVYSGEGCWLPGETPSAEKPTHRIEFSLPVTAQVHFYLLDHAGDLVVTLIDDTLPAGQHAITWDLTDEDGVPVPSGTYRAIVEVQGELVSESLIFLYLSEPSEILAAHHTVTDEDGQYVIPLELVAGGDVIGSDPGCTVSRTFKVVAVLDDSGTIRSGDTAATLALGQRDTEAPITIH